MPPAVAPIPLGGLVAPAVQAASCRLCVAGLCDDSQSSSRQGPAEAPAAIRRAYDGGVYNSCTEDGLDLGGRVADLGDWRPAGSWADTTRLFQEKAALAWGAGRVPCFLGGDHAVTVPLVRGLAVLGRPVRVIQLDAHPDLYPQLDGNPHSHACTGRQILEMPHVSGLVQLGLRAWTPAQREVARLHGARLISRGAAEPGPDPWADMGIAPDELVYLSVDLDACDPAFAPGVSHPVPGGFSARQVLDLVRGLPGRLVGMDVVELNPSRDLNQQTAVLAGRILHEGLGVAWRQGL